MTDHISIRPLSGTWVVRAGGAVLAETKNAVELTEGDYPPVVYIPRAAIAMAFLDASDTTTKCPHKGTASYYSIIAKSGAIKDAGWSYETPIKGVEGITGHIAFFADKAAVEEV